MKRSTLLAAGVAVFMPHAALMAQTQQGQAVVPQQSPAPSVSGPHSGSSNPNAHLVDVSELKGVSVYSEANQSVGEVDKVVANADNQRFVVIKDGGFFGLGEDRLVVPLSRVEMRDGKLTIRELVQSDISRIDGLRYVEDNYSDIDSPQRVELSAVP